MGSPSPAAPPDHAAPPVQLLRNSLGRSPPAQTALPGVGTCPGNSHRNGVHPHPQISVPFGGHSPSLLPTSQLCSSPLRNFSWEKIHRLRTALMTQRFCWPRFLCRLPGEARGRPNLIPSHGNPAQPPAPASLPLVFPPLFWKGGVGSLMSGMGGLQRVGLGRMMGGSGSQSKLLCFFSWWWKMSVGKEGFEKEGRKKRRIKGRKKGKRRKRGEGEKKGKIRKEK